MNPAQIVALAAQLIELGANGYARAQHIKALQESGVSDEQILNYLQRLQAAYEAHQQLDLRG